MSETARQLRVTRQTLHRILSGKAAITPDMAVRLGRFCGNGPGLWLRLQQNYDLWHAERRLRDAPPGARHQLRWIGEKSQRDAPVARQQEVQGAIAAVRIRDEHLQVAFQDGFRSWLAGRRWCLGMEAKRGSSGAAGPNKNREGHQRYEA